MTFSSKAPSSISTGNAALDALHASLRTPTSQRPALPRLLVAGAGGVLGNKVLRRLAGSARYAHTTLLVSEPMKAALSTVSMTPVTGPVARWPVLPHTPGAALTGLIMFEPPRLYYERERALWTPKPDELLALATWMHKSGADTLVVVTPHAPGRLPDAIKQGLASLDEHALSSLGFARVLLVRSARKADASTASGALEKLAEWMLSIVKYMIPDSEQPVRPTKLAEFIDEALRVLPPGTHVAAPELLWRASQSGNVGQQAGQRGMQALVRAWLDGRGRAPQNRQP